MKEESITFHMLSKSMYAIPAGTSTSNQNSFMACFTDDQPGLKITGVIGGR